MHIAFHESDLKGYLLLSPLKNVDAYTYIYV
jgi:hypothetical protein